MDRLEQDLRFVFKNYFH